MATTKNTDPILFVYNKHIDNFPYKALAASSEHKHYMSYYQSASGDQWIFLFSPDYRGGILIGGDTSWEIIPLGNGTQPVPGGQILTKEESLWLQACWMACSERLDKDNEVPDGAISLSLAAFLWGIAETKLKKASMNGDLNAKLMGNVWVTSFEEMQKLYGPPNPEKGTAEKRLEELNRSVRENIEHIRKILMEE